MKKICEALSSFEQQLGMVTPLVPSVASFFHCDEERCVLRSVVRKDQRIVEAREHFLECERLRHDFDRMNVT